MQGDNASSPWSPFRHQGKEQLTSAAICCASSQATLLFSRSTSCMLFSKGSATSYLYGSRRVQTRSRPRAACKTSSRNGGSTSAVLAGAHKLHTPCS